MTEPRSSAVSSPRAALREFDAAIVGGGLVGASLALGLAGTGVRVLLIEGVAPDSAAQPSFDERTTALGNASRRIFQGLGVWDEVSREAAAIRAIHVSDAGRFGFARLKAVEHGIDAFGYVVPNRVIGAALLRRLSTELERLKPDHELVFREAQQKVIGEKIAQQLAQKGYRYDPTTAVMSKIEG